MAFCELRIFSESLGRQTTVNVILPQENTVGEIGVSAYEKKGAYKCLYLLHGLSDDQSTWMRRTSIERYAQQYGLCVVMPFGDKSFYTDMRYGEKYYTYIAHELPRIIASFFPVSTKREDTFIGGLSMGGYGALKIALRNGDRYSAAAGLSSVADIKAFARDFTEVFVPIFGESLEIPQEEDLLFLAENQEKNPQKPRIFMGVGTEDFLYQSNQKLRTKFESLDYDYTYKESPGEHNWDFWDEYIQYVLKWMFA